MLFPWIPVLIGCGIGVWFSVPEEPGTESYVLASLALAGGVALALASDLARPLGLGVAALAAGWIAAGVRAHALDAPMLTFRYYGPVEGRIVEIDRSQSDALRLTLDRVVLREVAPDKTPARVRVSLQKDGGWLTPMPGQVVILTANLAAPDGPVEPGAFDFRRMAYFDQLGAVGYTRTPVLLLEEPAGGALPVDRLRRWLTQGMLARMDGQAGAFAAGAMTGDRSAITEDTVRALRDSSLAHLLAISGMNMAFLTGFVFALFRYGLALVPFVALRVNTKKVAAWVSLGVALFYLLLSGANVATERAFIMISVFLGAILLDRRALTLRSVAVAGMILLLAKPESLLDPGFQMSFAATIALIVGFAALDGSIYRQRLPRWLMPVFTLVLSSLIGGLSTAPYAAAHFNRFTDYGFLANVLTGPVMGAVVMPAGATAALLAPVGLEGLPLWVMEQGARWILFVAHWVAGLEGSVTAIPAPRPWVLPLFTLGAIWLILWRGRVQLVGALPVLAAFALWATADRPALLISGDGRLLGLVGPEGRALSAARGGGFAAENWLQNDGDLAAQEVAARRPGFEGPKGERWFDLAGLRAVSLSGKGAEAKLAEVCRSADLVILAAKAEAVPPGCRLIDQQTLAQTGPLALWQSGATLRFETTKGAHRLWSPPSREVDLPDLSVRQVALAGQ
ncbi:ComEC/Rec2 family competence protein [Rhodobacter sp. M37P]|uniref:ComEC/Rec2 family competence protein n=2 Tax=Rhodobacter calidifons TaxID=2715277 RepID=A0ABX0G988_9RHOB|nr:ComEC/Rec2 family competence protein [Rhodobacter calidifons]NHB77691.1 ComEC/Rec2 family competence protein [Rhodobacter calidifons]